MLSIYSHLWRIIPKAFPPKHSNLFYNDYIYQNTVVVCKTQYKAWTVEQSGPLTCLLEFSVQFISLHAFSTDIAHAIFGRERRKLKKNVSKNSCTFFGENIETIRVNHVQTNMDKLSSLRFLYSKLQKCKKSSKIECRRFSVNERRWWSVRMKNTGNKRERLKKMT